MSTQDRPVYVPRSPAEHVLSEILALFFALVLGIPASVGFFAAVFALTDRDAGAGALVGVNVGILLVSLAALGHVARHLAWLQPIAGHCFKGALWLCVRPRAPQPRQAQNTVLLPPPQRPRLTGMRIVPGEGLRYLRDDDPITPTGEMVDDAPESDEGHVIYDTPDNVDVIAIIDAQLLHKPKAGNWSRSGLVARFGWTERRAIAALDRLAALGLITPDKLQVTPHIDTIHIVSAQVG